MMFSETRTDSNLIVGHFMLSFNLLAVLVGIVAGLNISSTSKVRLVNLKNTTRHVMFMTTIRVLPNS